MTVDAFRAAGWLPAAQRRQLVSALGIASLLALSGAQGPRAWHLHHATRTEYTTQATSPGLPAQDQLTLRGGSPPPVISAPPGPIVPGRVDNTAATALTASGIPEPAYRAYLQAGQSLAASDPSCHLNWSVLAGIGRVESNHGRFAGSSINAQGVVTPPILGIRLDGSRPGTTRISDSDNGRYDGDTTTDRAVGPMQFLPGTWEAYGAGADPQDINAAALAAGRYLCAGGSSLATERGRWQAVYRYNHSDSYVSLVLSLADSYLTGDPTTIPARPDGTTTDDGEEPATPAGDPPAAPQLPATPPAPAPSTSPSPSPNPSPTTPSPSPTTPSPSPSGTPAPPASPVPTPTPSDPAPPTPTPDPSGTPPPPASAPAATPPGTPTAPATPSPAVPATPSPAVSGTPSPAVGQTAGR